MASSTPKVILVEVNSEDGSRPIHNKDKAAVTVIRPGHLLEMNTDEDIIIHASADGPAHPVKVAVEDPYGDDPTVSIMDNTYAIGDNVRYIYPQTGDLCYMLVEDSTTLVKGVTMLASAGDGFLQLIVPDAADIVGTVVGQAWEDVTISGSDTRALVRMV